MKTWIEADARLMIIESRCDEICDSMERPQDMDGEDHFHLTNELDRLVKEHTAIIYSMLHGEYYDVS